MRALPFPIPRLSILRVPVLAFATSWAAPGGAAPERGAQRPPDGHQCPHGERSALSELGCELERQLELTGTTLVATAPVRADVPIERPAELAERLVRVMGGALGSGMQLHLDPVSLAEARRLAARTGTLLYLSPELRHGRLYLAADVYVEARAFWDRVKNPSVAPVRHAHAERRADAEIRSFLPRPPVVVSERASAPLPDRPVLSLACGRLGEMLGDRIVLVGRRRISMGRLQSGALVRDSERDWQDLSPIAAAPLRAPIVTSRLDGGVLDVGSTDREHAVRLDGELELVANQDRVLPWPHAGCAPVTEIAAGSESVPCFGDEPNLQLPPLAGEALRDGIDAFTSTLLVRQDGSTGRVFLVRPAGASNAWLIDDAGRRVEVPDVGAQLALGDLDGDGALEVITARATLDPDADSLRVDSWQADGRLVRRYEVPLPDVQAIGVCPWPGSGLAPLVVAAKDRVWVLR